MNELDSLRQLVTLEGQFAAIDASSIPGAGKQLVKGHLANMWRYDGGYDQPDNYDYNEGNSMSARDYAALLSIRCGDVARPSVQTPLQPINLQELREALLNVA